MKKLRIDRKNKKGFQKFAAGVMALVMTVSGLTISPVRSEAAAAEYEIYPNPQVVQYTEGDYVIKNEVNVVYESGIDQATKDQLAEALALKDGVTVTTSESIEEGKTNILVGIDGSGEAEVDTGIGFFDHMLKSFAKHGLFDLKLKVTGDLIVDCHHTIEDVGIVLGEAIKEAIGDKMSIRRYGDIILPMDETLIMCAIDLSGRPYLGFESTFTADSVGYFDTQMVKEFFYAISYSAGMNLHIRKIAGENDHHIIEGMFKAFAKALDEATVKDTRIKTILSTKGSL